MYTVLPTNKLTVNDVITRADEQMYQEKLRYRRTQLAELEDVSVGSTNVACFQYDPTQLYEALIKSTDDFIYICNMKTGIFRYSPAQVKVLIYQEKLLTILYHFGKANRTSPRLGTFL